MKGLDYTALTVAIIGAVNWGLIGFFRLDLVALVFGNMTWLSRIIYAVVGICGLYLISVYGRISDHVLQVERSRIGLTLAIHCYVLYFVQLRIAKVKERLPYSCDST